MSHFFHHVSHRPHHILLWHPYEFLLAMMSLGIVGGLTLAALLHTDKLPYSPCFVTVEDGFCGEH